jgi:hypothetical protein
VVRNYFKSVEDTRMKRAAEHQLTKADIDTDREGSFSAEAVVGSDVSSGAFPSTSSSGTAPVMTSFGFGAYANINPFAAATASGGGLFSSTVDKSHPTSNSISSLPVEAAGVGSFGFGAYAKINPFVANTTVSSFTTAPSLSAGVGSGSSLMFGSNTNSSTLNAASTFDNSNDEISNKPISKISDPCRKLVIEATTSEPSANILPADAPAFSSYTTKAPFAVTIPSPLDLSPKTQNPFSNPSPKHNPFVSIVESKDNLWSSASRSSSETTTSNGESADKNRSNFPFPPSKSEENAKITVEEQSKILEESKSGIAGPDAAKDSLIVPNNSGSALETEVGAYAPRILSSKENDDEYIDEPKRVFGAPIVGGKENDVSKSNGDDDNPVGDDEYTEEQVYGKVYPMPDNVTVVTGEENEVCVIQVRAKLFRLSIPNEKMIASKKEHIDDHLAISKPVIPKTTVNILDSKSSGQNIDGKEILGNEEIVQEVKKEPSLSNKKKSAGEWIEVGIGPVRILKQREVLKAPDVAPKVATSATRLVMRREDKKGGKGGIRTISCT